MAASFSRKILWYGIFLLFYFASDDITAIPKECLRSLQIIEDIRTLLPRPNSWPRSNRKREREREREKEKLRGDWRNKLAENMRYTGKKQMYVYQESFPNALEKCPGLLGPYLLNPCQGFVCVPHLWAPGPHATVLTEGVGVVTLPPNINAVCKLMLLLAKLGLKTSFFKWTPDFDSAATDYEKAAVIYKNAKKMEDAMKMYIKAAQCHKECQAPSHGHDYHVLRDCNFWDFNILRLFHAAKAYENCGTIARDLKKYGESVDLIKKAAYMFREHGSPDTAAITLEKAAKMLESINPNQAVDLYLEAAEIVLVDERLTQAVDSVAKAARLLVRVRNLERALVILKKELDMNVELEREGKIHKVLVHLHRGDWVAADQASRTAMSYLGYAQSEVSVLLQELLEAYDQQDQDELSKALYNPYFTHLDNDYVKLARTLRVPGVRDGVSGGGAQNPGEADGNQDDQDEYAGGLC